MEMSTGDHRHSRTSASRPAAQDGLFLSAIGSSSSKPMDDSPSGQGTEPTARLDAAYGDEKLPATTTRRATTDDDDTGPPPSEESDGGGGNGGCLSRASSRIGRIRQKSGDIVNNFYVQAFILLLIVVNSIMMGIGTFPFVWDDPATSRAFAIVDYVFLSIFTLELAMQLVYHGWGLFKDGWLSFDFVIVVLSWALQGLQIIRAFRIFRALRLITRVKTMRNLVAALLSVMPRMGAITALLLLVFYVFAVMFTQLFKNLELSEAYFVTLDASFFTLFQMMTLDWAGIARETMEVYYWAWAPFVAFIMISSFIVFNLIIAVICDAVAFVNDDDEESEEDTLQKKVKTLSGQVGDMARSQQQMQHSLEFLSRQLQVTQIRRNTSTDT